MADHAADYDATAVIYDLLVNVDLGANLDEHYAALDDACIDYLYVRGYHVFRSRHLNDDAAGDDDHDGPDDDDAVRRPGEDPGPDVA